MRKGIFFILLLNFVFAKSNAQVIFELNGIGVTSNSNKSSFIAGGGGEITIYAPAIHLIKPSGKNNSRNSLAPLSLHFGASLYVSGMGNKTFVNVPLVAPESGDAKVYFSNTLFGANADVRFTAALLNGKVAPYLDGFAGFRQFNSDMNIMPNDGGKQSAKQLTKTAGLGFGATLGLQFRVYDGIFINTGVNYTYSQSTGEFIDIHSLNRVGNSIEYSAAPLSKDFLIYKLGVTCYFGKEPKGSKGSSHSSHHAWWEGWCSHSRSNGGGHSNINLIRR